MNKFLCLLMCAVFALSLAACGSSPAPDTEKAAELRAQYDFYDKSVKKISKGMSVTAEQADDIFITLASSCGLDGGIRSVYAKSGKDNTYSYYWEGSVKTYDVVLDNGVVSEVRYLSTVVYPSPIEDETLAIIPADTPSPRAETTAELPQNTTPPAIVETPSSTLQETEAPSTASPEPLRNDSAIQDDDSGANNVETHFNDYGTPEQQNTVEYVINTSTKKVHSPYCSDVAKIKPANYSTIESLTDALNKGYVPCKRCNPK